MARTQEVKLANGNGMLLLLALVAGLVAAVIVFVVVSDSGGGDSVTPVTSGTVPALVASRTIRAGTLVTEDMVKVVDVPESLVVSGVYDNADLVVGEVSTVTIGAGEQITRLKIGTLVPDQGLSGVVAPGMRAVSVKVDEVTAVGGNLLPGDHVDIVTTTRIDRAPGLAEDQYILLTTTVLQDVEVLSVAQEAQKPAAQAVTTDDGEAGSASYTSGQLPDDIKEQPNAGTLTLSLTPEQAVILISEQASAVRVWAILRAFGDDSTAELPPYEITLSN
ncbi:MAG: Flp pilus assembly protein CpaB [Gammaproteobacteria bacterium]